MESVHIYDNLNKYIISDISKISLKYLYYNAEHAILTNHNETITSDITFIGLMKQHYGDKFDIKQFINDHDKNETFSHLDSLKLHTILPGTKIISEWTDYSIAYHGRCCTAELFRLYEYKEYYIVYSFSTEDNDVDVLSFHSQNFEGLMDVLIHATYVYKKDAFNYENVFKKSCKNDIKFMTDFFREVYPTTGHIRLQEFISRIFFEE
jgi:hypothetical protein